MFYSLAYTNKQGLLESLIHIAFVLLRKLAVTGNFLKQSDHTHASDDVRIFGLAKFVFIQSSREIQM